MRCAAAAGTPSWTRAATCPRPCGHRRARSQTAGLLLRLEHLRLPGLHAGQRRGEPCCGARRPARGRGDGRELRPAQGAVRGRRPRRLRRASSVVRPGLIVGPYDPTGRFTYWPHRIARGGEVLAPGPRESPTQVIDVRDLGAWIVALCGAARDRHVQRDASRRQPGAARSPRAARSRSDAEITWVSPEFLVEHDVGEWMELRSGSSIPRWSTRIAWT